MRLAMKTRGAVSIFLVLVLVPMMIISGLFVDAGKVYLGKSVTESAGDLALNTALTDYDTKLKDMYGLFATAQDTEELFEKLEDYYRTCITSSGLNGSEADLYVDRMMAQLGVVSESDDTADILNMQLVDFTAEKREEAALNNPAVLKKQIVDFMKYRAPINLGMSFFSSLQSFSNLDKQTDLVDKRTEYYTTQQTVMENLQTAWGKIRDYEKSTVVKTENYFPDMQSFMNGIKGKYENDNKKTIKDLYDTQNYIDYSCSIRQEERKERNAEGTEPPTTTPVWKFTYSATGAAPLNDYTENIYYNKYNKNNLPTKAKIKELMQSFYNALNEIEAYKADLESNNSDDKYPLQYLVQNLRSGKLTGYTNKLQNVYTSYQAIKTAMIWVEGYDLDGVDKKDKNDNPITSQSIKDSKIKLSVSGKNKTLKISEHFANIENKFNTQMEQASSYVVNYFSNISSKIKSNGITDTSGTDADVSAIASQVNSYVTELEQTAEALNGAVTYLTTAKSLINGELKTKKENWSNAAKDKTVKNTSMAKQDQAEIEKLGDYLDSGEIEKLISRLTNIKNNLLANIEQIKSYKFDGKFVGEIQNYSDLQSVIGGKCGDSNLKNVPLNEEVLNNKATEWFSFDFTQINAEWVHQSGTQIKLNTEDKLNFYSYLYTHFMNGEESEKTEDENNGKNLYKNIKDTSSSQSKETAEKTKTDGTKGSGEISTYLGDSRPSITDSKETPSGDIHTGEKAVSETSKGLGSMFKNLSDAVLKLGSNLRDNLYVSEYILTMFSYDAMENEYKEKGITDTSEITTLTLQGINSTNNYAYGGEVEYIIYGGTCSGSITKAYASIFGIRLAFNLIYAFSASEIRDMALAIATPISAATLGVIPVPLIQAAIILGIACCESAIDITDLKAGKEVPLFKNKKSWRCSVSGLIDAAKGVAGDFISTAANELIDQGYAKLSGYLDMADDELTSLIESGEEEITKAVGDAYDDLITRHANMAIQKLTTLANNAIEEQKLHADIVIQDYIHTGLDEWLSKEKAVDGAGSIAYAIKETAVNQIKSMDLTPLVSQLEKAEEDAANTIKNVVEDIRGKIISAVENTCQKVKDAKEQLKSKTQEAMGKGAKELKETVSSGIDDLFGSTSEGTSENTGVASLLSFSYSDYLRLFLMIGLFANGRAIYLRTADVIQANMRHQGEEGFLLSNSAVYVDVKATVLVQPTFMALPLFSDMENNPVDDTSWYTVTYKDTRGY